MAHKLITMHTVADSIAVATDQSLAGVWLMALSLHTTDYVLAHCCGRGMTLCFVRHCCKQVALTAYLDCGEDMAQVGLILLQGPALKVSDLQDTGIFRAPVGNVPMI